MGKAKRVFFRILKYMFLLILLLAAAVAVVWFYSTREPVVYVSPTTPVQVQKPERQLVRDSFFLNGYVEAEAMVPIVPFVQGTLTEYYAVAGKTVKKGDLLAVVDPEPYELQKKQAEAAYLAYQATFDRVSALYSSGAATQQNYDEVKAQRDASKAQYDLACLQLGYAYVTATVDGTVLMAPLAVGAIGTSTSPVAVIADLDNLVVNIAVPEKYFSIINEDVDSLKVLVTRNAGDDTVSAECEILSVSPYVDPASKTFAMKVKLKTNISSFRPGMYIKAEIIHREEEVYALPLSAKKLDGSVYYVEEAEDGTLKAKYIVFDNLLSNDTYFQVPDAFIDASFIVRGQNGILSGTPVTIVEGF